MDGLSLRRPIGNRLLNSVRQQLYPLFNLSLQLISETIQDSELLYYWQKAFPQLSGNKSIGSIITRLDTFLAPKPIRYMVSQPENRLDFADIMDSGKIFLAKLPEGLLGKENSYLLGALLVGKFQQLAMARQSKQIAARRDFWIYIDEFHQFITPSMAQILSGARKYRIGLTLAHQELQQLERNRDVASAVMSNPYTRVVFRVGDNDAKKLAEGFSYFDAKDLQNLETGQAICRVERADFDFNLSVPSSTESNRPDSSAIRNAIITASREKYAMPRTEIEAALRANWEAATAEREERRAKPAQPILKDAEEAPLSKPAEVPKSAVARTTATEEPDPDDVKPLREIPPVRDLGRGGAQHKAIQQRLKVEAERLGFLATIEKQVLDGDGSIDLLLQNSERQIACEITITTSIDQEVGNIAKCARAGFDEIVLISIAEARLRRIEAAVVNSLGPDIARRVTYVLPDAFIERLRAASSITLQRPAREFVERRGYRVKRKSAELSPTEQKARDEEAIRAMAEAMKKKRPE
jgi:hypothetical protein